ncbi:hypothetical protein ACFE04_020809 [Oxalis oulophora]
MEGSIAMNGGDGPYSYTRNSEFQGKVLNIERDLFIKTIQQNLTIDSNNNQVFRIADLGCSVGPNTFTCVQIIIDAVQRKLNTLGLIESKLPEFQVFFNDRVTNDFNSLFKNLPSQRPYMAASAPGCFYDRLFPKASMNFINSSYTNHWLSKVPEEVTMEGSIAWNKGCITYADNSIEVLEAYKAQFFKDIATFFANRSLELAKDGLLAVLMPCRRDGSKYTDSLIIQGFHWLGDALYDLAKEGKTSEAMIDSFNLPMFIPSPSEVKEVVSKNVLLSIKTLEIISYPVTKRTPEFPKMASVELRAVLEGIMSQHFGSGIMDDVFEKYADKIAEAMKKPLFAYDNTEVLFLLVKRNTNS